MLHLEVRRLLEGRRSLEGGPYFNVHTQSLLEEIRYIKCELLRTCFSRILAADIAQKYSPEHMHAFACIWLLILHGRIQFLKESWVVATESFSIELIEVIVHKCSKKGIFEILEELIRKHPQRNTTSDDRV